MIFINYKICLDFNSNPFNNFDNPEGDFLRRNHSEGYLPLCFCDSLIIKSTRSNKFTVL